MNQEKLASSKLLIIAVFMLVPFLAYTQEQLIQNPIPPEPTAASLGKYGEIPVNLSSGLPQISVPLFVANGQRLQVPISLSYHASGIKVEETASWVGLGWSLNAGGVINRSINGIPDFVANNGFYDAGNWITNFTPPTNPMDPSYQDDITLANDLAAGVYDTEPDAFHFNFNGFSGTFYINFNTIDISIIPHRKWVVVPNDHGTSNDINSFKIITENGDQYFFEDIIKTNTNSPCRNPQHPIYNYNSSWYLTKIVSANNLDEVYFYYSDQFSISTDHHISEHGSKKAFASDDEVTTNCDDPVFYESRRLERISTSQHEIHFTASKAREDLPGDKALGFIEIFNNRAELIKKFAINTDYFSNATNDRYNKRLKLESVQEIGADGIGIPPYLFAYYEDLAIPSLKSKSQDLWGYYNGQTPEPSTLLPQLAVYATRPEGAPDKKFFELLGAENRQLVNLEATKVATLRQIQYPTGGHTTFQYENHDYDPGKTPPTTPSSNPFAKDYDVTNFVINEDREPVLLEARYDEDIDGNPIPEVTQSSTEFELSELYDNHFLVVRVRIEGEFYPGNSNPYQGSQINEVVIRALTGPDAGTDRLNVSSKRSCDAQRCSNGVYNWTHNIVLKPGRYRATVKAKQPIFSAYSRISFSYVKNIGVAQDYPKTIGGLRVSKIENFSPTGGAAPQIKVYQYKDPQDQTLSSAILRRKEVNGYVNYQQGVGTDDPTFNRLSHSRSGRNYSPVYYTSVTELQGNNGENGKTEYDFRFPQRLDDPDADYFPFPYSSPYAWAEGLEKARRIFKKDVSGNYQILKEIINEYDVIDATHQVFGFQVAYHGARGDGIPGFHKKFSYPYLSGYSQLKWTKEVDYHADDEQKKTTKLVEYFYDNTDHLQLTRQVASLTNNEKITTRTLYPHDKPGMVGQADMITNNIIAVPVESQVWREDNTGKKVIGGTITEYLGDILPDNHFLIELNDPYPFTGSFPPDLSTFYDDLATESYKHDEKGNVIEIVRRGGPVTSFLWGYDQTLPVAEILNATYAEVTAQISSADLLSIQGNSLTGQQLSGKVDLIRTNLPQAQVTAFTYKPGIGISTITDPNGITSYFQYDCLGRLRRLKDADEELVKTFQYQYYTGDIGGPVPCIELDFSYVSDGANVSFSPEYSLPEGITISALSWNFGDGQTSSVTSPSHTYQTEGPFDVTLTITALEDTWLVTKTVTLDIQPLTVSVSGGGSSIKAGTTVVFTALVTGGSRVYTKYEWWTNNSGVIESGPSQSFVIATNTTSVTVRVTDSFGNTKERTKNFVAQPPPNLIVLNPNATTTWTINGSGYISWDFQGSVGNSVNIDLLKGTNSQRLVTGIGIGDGGVGSYTWSTVNPLQGPGTGYKVKVTTNTGFSDESVSFKISSGAGGGGPTLTLNISIGGGGTTATANVGGTCSISKTYSWQRYNGSSWSNIGGNSSSVSIPAGSIRVRCTVTGCSLSVTRTKDVPF